MTWRQSDSALRNENKTSRAINVDVARQAVIDACAKKSIAISSIEALPAGGTRVVLVNSEGADQVRALYKSKLLDPAAVRTSWVANR